MKLQIIKSASTETLFNEELPKHDNYVGEVWSEKIQGQTVWHTNNGIIFLWNFPTKDLAIQAIVKYA